MLQKQLPKQLRFHPELAENKLVRKHDEGKKEISIRRLRHGLRG